jgi:hypothetical protein
MATNIVGQFPILNSQKSQTDEYGFDYITFEYTIKTSDLAAYNIKKDDVFTSISAWRGVSFSKIPSSGATYVVDAVENENMSGGLTRLTVNTVGTKNSIESNTPRVSLISGGPLIFGLSGTTPNLSISGYGISGAGQSVEVKFLADGGALGQQGVFATYFASVMPATFRGISLPVPASPPISFSNVVYQGGGPTGGGLPVGVDGIYYGFVCKTVLTEKRGSLLLVTLTFSEAGKATSYTITSPTTGTGTDIYNFPLIG